MTAKSRSNPDTKKVDLNPAGHEKAISEHASDSEAEAGALDHFRECSDEASIDEAFGLIRQLRPKLTTSEQWNTAFKRQAKSGYRVLLAIRDGVPRALAGFRIQENLIHGKFLYVDDLVTDSHVRSTGIGKKLLEELEWEAQHSHCDHLVLDTALSNKRAQRFYEHCKMSALAARYVKRLVVNDE